VQNIKEVEDYQHQIFEGNLPLLKGHFLNRTDQLIRQHIGDIMCQGTTYLTEDEKRQAFVPELMHRLQPLKADGLIQIEPNQVTVTPKGKPFLRNIAFQFDARYWNGRPTSVHHTFSRSV
jgi:oxygen-independent coproporphyrinogen III oxidase